MQILGSTLDVHCGCVPSVHLVEPDLVSLITFLSTPDLSLMMVVSFLFSLAEDPSAHLAGGFLSTHVGIVPSVHFGGVPVADPVAQVPGAFPSVHVGAF